MLGFLDAPDAGTAKVQDLDHHTLPARARHPGLRAGLLDADVFGPSVPLLMGVKGPPKLDEKSQMLPHVAHGVSCMSMGFLMKGPSPSSRQVNCSEGRAWSEPEAVPFLP